MKASILIPAHNEADYLPACLNALLASEDSTSDIEVIVIANGCTDNTVQIAQGFDASTRARGWRLEGLDLVEGNKLTAWNAGESAANGDVLIYLDADVQVSSPLIGQIVGVLRTSDAAYASGVPKVTTTGQDSLIDLYTRFWTTTPFMVQGVPGFGIFAMNRAGRARWGAWPDIISDDTFARLHFSPDERCAVQATYEWPMVEGFKKLVQVRRRQDIGVAEIVARFPELMGNDDPPHQIKPLWRRVCADPLAFLCFLMVRCAIRLPILRSDTRWVRGR